MDVVTVLLFLVLLGATLAYVGWPLLQPALAEEGPSLAERRRVDLQDEKERLLGAIKDLDLDHRTGKMGDVDYEALTGRLKAEAADVLRRLDQSAPPPRAASPADRGSLSPAGAKGGELDYAAAEPSFCTQCGRQARADDKFCGGCGAAVPRD